MYFIHNRYKEIYFDFLPVYFTCTTLLGGLLGSGCILSGRPSSAIDCFLMIIGCSGIGMITGITYPISFPLIGCYVLYKIK